MYYLFILAIGAERLIEMAVSRRNANWSFANGGKEFGRGHFPAMIAMHTLLLVSCITEVAVFHRPFVPWLGWSMVGVVVVGCVPRRSFNPPARELAFRAATMARKSSTPPSPPRTRPSPITAG